MKTLLTIFTLVFTVMFSISKVSYARTVLNLICDLHTFNSTNGQYLSKDLGHSFSDGRTFFYLEFGGSFQKLNTDMSVVADTTITEFSDKGNVIEITTAVDVTHRYYTFEINRMTGRIILARINAKDINQIEVFKYDCRSAKRKF